MINSNFLKFAKVALFTIVIGVVAYGSYKKLVAEKTTVKKEHKFEPASVATNLALKDSIVDFGMGLLGTSYVAGGCSKDGFDCSGFVFYVFEHFDITVPRSSSGFKNFGQEIPIDKVEKGDILVFLSPTRNEIGHIGIVSKASGRQSEFIHSSSGREMKVIITSLTNAGYTKRFVKAVRVL